MAQAQGAGTLGFWATGRYRVWAVEVIADFLNGDPDQPIGCHGAHLPPEKPHPAACRGTKTVMTIRPKRTWAADFNELKFDDATGREQVYIHAQKNMDVALNDRTNTVNTITAKP